jgi:type I restriction enzyme, S subunit
LTYLGINTPELRFDNFTAKWDHRPLGELGSFKNGLNKDKADFGFGVEFVNLMNVFGKSILEDVKFDLVNASQKEIDSYSLKSGDVLFIRSSVKRTGVGETSLIPKDLHNIVYSGFLIRFRENSKTLDLNYKRYCFSIGSFRKKLLSLATTSANTNINQESLEKIVLSFPSLPEQQKIAAFLSAVDKKIQLLQRKKELLEQYKKGVMQKIFSQEIRFKDENGNDYPVWEEMRLGDVGTFKSGTGFSEIEQGGVLGTPFYKVSDMNRLGNENQMMTANNYVSDHQIAKLKYKPIKGTAIIFAKVGAAIFLERKRIATNFLIDNNMMAFIPVGDVEFFRFSFQLLRLSKYAQVGALPSYNASDLRSLKIVVPTAEEQKRVVSFLSKLEEIVSLANQRLEKMQQFKKGLLQQMFV